MTREFSTFEWLLALTSIAGLVHVNDLNLRTQILVFPCHTCWVYASKQFGYTSCQFPSTSPILIFANLPIFAKFSCTRKFPVRENFLFYSTTYISVHPIDSDRPLWAPGEYFILKGL